MEIYDAQIHTWTADSPDKPWDRAWGLEGPAPAETMRRMEETTVPYDVAIAAMDAVGVQGALAVSHRIYGFDNSYVLEAAAAHPGRLKAVGLIDHRADDVDETVAEWSERPETAGLRITLTGAAALADFRSGGMDRVLAAAENHEAPLFLYPPGIVSEVGSVAERFPALRIVIDHFGLRQPPFHQADVDPLAPIADLLTLAKHPNVSVKASALPILSSEPFPFHDIWPSIEAVRSAFGAQRVFWGSDFTRVAGSHSYREAVAYVRDELPLDDADKESMLGRALSETVGWGRDAKVDSGVPNTINSRK